jgi:hypothetical protein
MPVLNLEKPGRFKKGGTAMKKPVAKNKGGTTAKSDRMTKRFGRNAIPLNSIGEESKVDPDIGRLSG